jgi:glycosyltransferase involved in cell wall biosynthesis
MGSGGRDPRTRVLIDLRCLETVTGARGVGRHVTELVRAMPPHLPAGWELLGLSWTGQGRRLGLLDVPYPGPRRGISLADELILPRLTRRHRIDLYHSPVYPLFRAAPGSPRRIITVHDLIPEIYPEAFTWRQRRVFAKAFRSAVTADRVITVSHTTRRDLISRHPCDPERVVTVYNGISACFLERHIATESAPYPHPYLLHVGGLDPTKNVPFLLEVLATLRRGGEPFHLVLVCGDDPRLPDVRQHARALGVLDALTVPGRLTDEELGAAYGGAAAFLFPSLYEGFGLPPLEALACGCPVVASPLGSLREVLGEHATLLPPTAAEKWAGAIRGLLRERRGSVDRNRLTALTWDAAARQTVAVFTRCVRSGCRE